MTNQPRKDRVAWSRPRGHAENASAYPAWPRGRGHATRPKLAILAAMAAVVALVPAFASPQRASAPVAKAKELIAREPFDRITLIDNTTWDVEPLAPRPLPPIDKKKKARPKNELPHEGNIGAPGQKSTVEVPKEDEEEPLIIHMLEGDVRDYKVKREHIKSVDYYEDMLIAEAGRLTASGKYGKAFEHLLMARSRAPKWPRLEDAVDKLLFAEGSQALTDNDTDRGLRLLGELYRRRPDYPGLGDKLASLYLGRIRKAFDVRAYAAGRQVLRELETLAPGNAAIAPARELYVGRARGLLDRARAVMDGERLDLILEAASVWPALEGLESAYREAFAAMPTLDVAVADLPDPVGPWLKSSAAVRTAPLLYRPILASADEEGTKGSLPDQLAASVETVDLSRGMRIKIRTGFLWNDGSRPVSAIDVARSLVDRTVPTLPGYSARWADLLERVEATDDEQLEIRLARSTLRPEHWLLIPVGPAHGGGDGWVAAVGQGRRPVGDGPYRWVPSSAGVAQYVAVTNEGTPGPKVRRVREVRYASADDAVAALERGDVSLVEEVAPAQLVELGKVAGVRVGQYATPSLHRIALDGRNEALRNRTLRRALSLAIDRKDLLEESVLRRKADSTNAVADGPFLKGSYADAPDVSPLPYDPWLAKALVAAARKEMGGVAVKLTFEHPPTLIARAVCPKLADAWREVGVEVTLKEVPERDLEAKLRAGGRFDLAYRAARPGEPAFDAGPTICPAYDAPPSSDPLAALASPRILQLLLQLDRAPETTAAQALLLQIDRESRDELPILPLWQVVDHYAWRGRVKGIGDEARHIYQGIESWEVEPWYPAESR
jgi:peptide/nickel transport system substrate-binding protein